MVDLVAHTATGFGNDTLLEIEDVVGTPFDDTLLGDGKRNRLSGESGDDHIEGLGGNDLLDGFLGNDFLDGGTGSDQCIDGETLPSCEL